MNTKRIQLFRHHPSNLTPHAAKMMRRTGFFVLAILCNAAASEYTAVMDLSYKPHLKAATLSRAIRHAVDERPLSAVELDVSFSDLGNEGIVAVLQSLQTKELYLSARMNRLTPEGVANMLKSILGDDAKNESPPPFLLRSLDLGWNNLGPDQTGWKEFLSSLRRLIEVPEKCPRILRLCKCGLGPAACRAIGKGIIKRFESLPSPPPLTLHLCGNEAIGDAGTAALAAAIRSSQGIVMKELDLSSCEVGDAGAEALALALERVQELDLSNNKITDEGAAAIGRALTEVTTSLDLSNNHEIGDAGATEIAAALGRGVIHNVSLRSCQVYADGAKALGMALVSLSKCKQETYIIRMDFSGNPLGILRGKKKSDGGKYSASNLKSKASKTTASYMNFIGKNIKCALKDTGLDAIIGNRAESGDSDDEEEDEEDDSRHKHDASKARCGAKAFASAIVVSDFDEAELVLVEKSRITCHFAVRHCFLDRGGADALAAAVIQAKQRLGVELVIDARMNPVLEEEMVDALRGDDPDTLEEMAERHMSVLETLRIAEERAVEAAAAAAARRREEAECESDYGGLDLDRFEHDDDEYDSDAKYDDEE